MSEINWSETVVKQLIKNQKADRFWRNLRFFIVILLILALLISGYESKKYSKPHKPYVALVRLNGEIGTDNDFTARTVIPRYVKRLLIKKPRACFW